MSDLEKYGKHKLDCDFTTATNRSELPCSCGLAEAIEAEEKNVWCEYELEGDERGYIYLDTGAWRMPKGKKVCLALVERPRPTPIIEERRLPY